ncbi:hypothetical protein PIB30_066516, partial [Stylosanthes scabra]|nr:hypothetical protein [Stylosanthes scabra]
MSRVFGFRVEKLQELGKNEVRRWRSSVVPPPSDFYFKLPARDMRPFLFHSNLYFTGAPPRAPSSTNSPTLDITTDLLYDKCYVENIQGDVYLLVLHKMSYIGGITGHNPVLCVLVLGLALIQEQHQGQIFLSVDVLANQGQSWSKNDSHLQLA